MSHLSPANSIRQPLYFHSQAEIGRKLKENLERVGVKLPGYKSVDELVKNYKKFQSDLMEMRDRLIDRFQRKYGDVKPGVPSKTDLFNSATESALDLANRWNYEMLFGEPPSHELFLSSFEQNTLQSLPSLQLQQSQP